MLKIENTEVVGWEHAIRGMRNPKNSWDKSDSKWGYTLQDGHIPVQTGCEDEGYGFDIGPNDQKLMLQLANGGPVHAKYRRMIVVYLDITAPLYWWKEFDTYKVGTISDSCSTMHKIGDKEFTWSDFSAEHLVSWEEADGDECVAEGIMQQTILALNFYRKKYLEAKTKPMKEESKRAGLVKKYWWQMIQLLPTSYNQKRTIMLNYEVLVNIYHSRKNHKLDEWHTLCDWIESLPYSEIITGIKEDTNG